MKSLFVKTLSILLAVTLVTSGLPGRMPLTAEAKAPAGMDDRAGSTPGTEEAERARALVLESPELGRMQQLSARDGLHLRTDRQPLVFLREENGQRAYGADQQAVSFLGEKEGQRVYQVFLGFEKSPRVPERSVLERESTHEDSFVFAFVDVASEKVLDVVRVDIGGIDGDGAQRFMLRNHTGRQAKFLVTRDGTLMQISDNGMPIELGIDGGTKGCRLGHKLNAPLPDEIICGLQCAIGWAFACEMATMVFPGVGLVCAFIAIAYCFVLCTTYG